MPQVVEVQPLQADLPHDLDPLRPLTEIRPTDRVPTSLTGEEERVLLGLTQVSKCRRGHVPPGPGQEPSCTLEILRTSRRDFHITITPLNSAAAIDRILTLDHTLRSGEIKSFKL